MHVLRGGVRIDPGVARWVFWGSTNGPSRLMLTDGEGAGSWNVVPDGAFVYNVGSSNMRGSLLKQADCSENLS